MTYTKLYNARKRKFDPLTSIRFSEFVARFVLASYGLKKRIQARKNGDT